MYQAKSGVISFPSWVGVGGVAQKIKVAQNGVNHVLVLEFLRLDELYEISCGATKNIPLLGNRLLIVLEKIQM